MHIIFLLIMFTAWAATTGGLAYYGHKRAGKMNIAINIIHIAGLAVIMMATALLFGWLTTELYTGIGFYSHQPVR